MGITRSVLQKSEYVLQNPEEMVFVIDICSQMEQRVFFGNIVKSIVQSTKE